jgi:hypothetical protein
LFVLFRVTSWIESLPNVFETARSTDHLYRHALAALEKLAIARFALELAFVDYHTAPGEHCID